MLVIFNNNLRSNEWTFNNHSNVWTNKYGYNVKNTGKMIFEGKEIRFPIACETNDDLEGKALRFEYTGDGSVKKVATNKWYNYDEQHCYRQKHITRNRNQRKKRRRRNCDENNFQLEKEYNLKNKDKNNEHKEE
jgi:hypothetical protein